MKEPSENLAMFSEDFNITPKTLEMLWDDKSYSVKDQMQKFCHKSLAAISWNDELRCYFSGIHNLLLCHIRSNLTPEQLQDKYVAFIEKHRKNHNALSTDGSLKLFALSENEYTCNGLSIPTQSPRYKQTSWTGFFESPHDDSKKTLVVYGEIITDMKFAQTSNQIAACTDHGTIMVLLKESWEEKKIDVKTYIEVLKDFEIFLPNGDLRTLASTKEWESATKIINKKLKPITVYLHVKNNIENIKNCLQEIFFGEQKLENVKHNDEDEKSFKSETSETSENSEEENLIESSTKVESESEESGKESHKNNENSEEENLIESSTKVESESEESEKESHKNNEKVMKINPNLKRNQVIKLNPELQSCKLILSKEVEIEDLYAKDILPNDDNKLPPYLWTSALIRVLSEKLKIKCPYNFRKGQVYTSYDDRYFDFEGTCPVCKNFIYGVCIKKPIQGEILKIYIDTLNTESIIHVKKRPVFGEQRRKMMSQLKYMTAYHLRSEMINDNASFNDYLPPDIRVMDFSP
ncbi:hypothetical protein TKK_0005583 [Trichogramma kaykai]